jgi:DNA topoisomerase-1
MASLVIVESPTKARTIRDFLPRGYKVAASMGHIRDLPDKAADIPAKYKAEDWARLGVNVDQDFEPLYVVPADKRKVVAELKALLKDADELILATDEDREGESISWHLKAVLSPRVPVKRMVFHEITKEAIREALDTTRKVDDKLVRAQETRRILDRLYGYTLSPLLWKKIAYGLSAGRVQSVAVRILVLRERERRAFRAAIYWDLKAHLRHAKQEFDAELIALKGSRIAVGKDFDESTGKLAVGKQVVLLDEPTAARLRERLLTRPWKVSGSEEKPGVRRPAPPFTTSTLQQEANRKLRLSARETMRVAQNLYENGYITYMRTDSVHLSNQAVTASRECVDRLYGKDYLPPKTRHYTAKNVHAQEAHEAIRPAGSHFRTPDETKLTGREYAVYDLIWKRTVACQMLDARITSLVVTLDVDDATFRATGKRIDFPGFLRAYVEGSDDPEAALEDQEVLLPHLEVGDSPTCTGLDALSHETQPPARFTEASLVRELEADGIGRPSTYASIIGTIVERGYVQKVGQALVPTFTAFAVIGLLEEHFPRLVDLKFTARMEEELDEIAEGNAQWLPYLQHFYLGKDGLRKLVESREKLIDPAAARTVSVGGLKDATIRIGRFGPYVEVDRGGEVLRASLPRDAAPADLTMETVEEILRQKREGPDILGHHPAGGEPIMVLTGQYGPYVQLGQVTDENPKPKRSSLPKGMKPEEVTIEIAVGLLALPRLLGTHPESSGKIFAGQGRFGPYVVHEMGAVGKDYRSIKGDDRVLTITLARALEMLAQPKLARGRRAAPAPLKELGPHPADKAPVALYDGQYGPYVKHGSISASIPKGTDPQSVTLAQAVDLIAIKAGRTPAARVRKAPAAARVRKAPAAVKKAPKPKAAPKSAKAKLLKVRKVVKAKRGALTGRRPRG